MAFSAWTKIQDFWGLWNARYKAFLSVLKFHMLYEAFRNKELRSFPTNPYYENDKS